MINTGRYWTKPWNVFTGCSPCGPACDNCWARALAARFPAVHGDFTPRFHRERLEDPVKWRKPQVVFCNNTGDWLHEAFMLGQVRSQLEVMREAPRHQYLTLTKRVELLLGVVEESYDVGYVSAACWWGATAWDADSCDRAMGVLPRIAGRTWLSLEPLLGPVDLDHLHNFAGACLNWVVVGCESGAGRRVCDPDWIASIVEQCQLARVPVWVKQVDVGGRCSHDPSEWPRDVRVRQLPPELERILSTRRRST